MSQNRQGCWGRPGFREWSQLSETLTLLAAEPAPRDRIRIWWYDPETGGRAPEGRLALESDEPGVTLMIDGQEALRLDERRYRGAWLEVFDDGQFSLDIDGLFLGVQIGSAWTNPLRE